MLVDGKLNGAEREERPWAVDFSRVKLNPGEKRRVVLNDGFVIIKMKRRSYAVCAPLVVEIPEIS